VEGGNPFHAFALIPPLSFHGGADRYYYTYIDILTHLHSFHAHIIVYEHPGIMEADNIPK